MQGALHHVMTRFGISAHKSLVVCGEDAAASFVAQAGAGTSAAAPRAVVLPSQGATDPRLADWLQQRLLRQQPVRGGSEHGFALAGSGNAVAERSQWQQLDQQQEPEHEWDWHLNDWSMPYGRQQPIGASYDYDTWPSSSSSSRPGGAFHLRTAASRNNARNQQRRGQQQQQQQQSWQQHLQRQQQQRQHFPGPADKHTVVAVSSRLGPACMLDGLSKIGLC